MTTARARAAENAALASAVGATGRSRRRIFAALTVLVTGWIAGCAQTVPASSVLRRDPDLTSSVQMSGRGGSGPAEAIGTAYASAVGHHCEPVAAQALRNLVARAKEMGGQRVVDAEFKGRFLWSGTPQCSGRTGSYSAQVRGIAVR